MRQDPWQWISVTATVLALAGCSSGEPLGQAPPVDAPSPEDDVVRSAVSPPPITGGTLLVLEEGRAAVASDPDRDLVHVVDLELEQVRHTIELPAGDEPGRLVADADGRVHVAARHGGVVVDLDPTSGAILARRAVCPNPRGIAYDPALDSLHVACAGGQLVSLPAAGGEPWRRVKLATDLRDVLITDQGLMVSRFREAALLQLDDDGAVIEHHALPVIERSVFTLQGEVLDRRRPNTAWRTVATPDGDWLMLHLASTDRELHVGSAGDPSEDTGGSDSGGETEGLEPGGGDGGYGGGFDPCAAAVHPMLTVGREALDTVRSPLLLGLVLPVDVAIAPSGRIAMAVAGRSLDPHDPQQPGLAWTTLDSFSERTETGCEAPHVLPAGDGQIVAVDFDPTGRIVAQSREPAQLVIVDPNDGRPTLIELPGEPRRDTGHDLFHLDAGAGIACATCHPEGGDDGHVWHFAGFGPRHTPALTVGLAGTEPFHWEGDLADMRVLVEEVHQGRMGGRPQSPAHVEALQSWMFAMASTEPLRSPSDAAATRGAALFDAWGCAGCHTGTALAGNTNVDLGLGLGLQVPGLRGVALHPPYMHDGRAADLPSAVLDMLARTRPSAPAPSEQELGDMIAFLESL